MLRPPLLALVVTAVLLSGCEESARVSPTAPAATPTSAAPAAPTAQPSPPAFGQRGRVPSQPPPFMSSAGCGMPASAGDSIETVEIGALPRTYRLHVPPTYRLRRATPVVLNFHGSNRTAAAQEEYSGLWRVADRAGFILIGPESPWGEWDIGGWEAGGDADDLAYVQAILAQVSARLCIDPARIYATGFSNGAEMASLVGCRMADVFAAIAPVAGVEFDEDCGERPMPVLSFQGTEDYNVFFEDAPPAMADWAEHNGCGAAISVKPISASVRREAYDGCGTADVVLYIIEGGGHTWPGAADDAGGVGGIGFTTHDIDANDLIWQFFSAHRLGS